jgi:Fe-S-cluster containining protein
MLKPEFVQITRQKKIAEEDFYPMINAVYEQIWQNLLPPQVPTDNLTTRVANNILTPPGTPVPDCVACGACCVALPCVGVRPAEELAEEDYWDVTTDGAAGAITVDRFVRRDAESLACAALVIKDGTAALCRVYERRPQICRDFEAGSDKCHALRRAFGFEPFLSLEEMSEALEKLEKRPLRAAPSETIREVKFAETETGELWVTAYLKDGSNCRIHVFDPLRETWRQFEFDGLTLAQAKNLIESR